MDSEIVSLDEFTDGDNLAIMQEEGRVLTVEDALLRCQSFDRSTLEYFKDPRYVRELNAFGGLLKIFTVNLGDSGGAISVARESDQIKDAATLVSFIARKVKWNKLTYQEEQGVIRGSENSYHYPDHGNILEFINMPLNALESGRIFHLAFNFYAPVGTAVVFNGQFMRSVGGPLQHEDYDFDQDFIGGRRDEHATFTDMLNLPSIHTNEDIHLFAGIWRDVVNYFNTRLYAASVTESFRLGVIQILVVRKLAGGCSKVPRSLLINDMKVRSFKCRKGDCLFATLRHVRTDYTNTKRKNSKKNMRVYYKYQDKVVEHKPFTVDDDRFIRERFKLPKGQPIRVDNNEVLQFTSNHFQVSFTIIDDNNSQLNRIEAHDWLIDCILVLKEDHYYLEIDGLREQEFTRCVGCCHKYLLGSVHTCYWRTSLFSRSLRKSDQFIFTPYIADEHNPCEKMDLTSDVVYYDLETREVGDKRIHITYAIGFMACGEYYSYYGDNCLDRFCDLLCRLEDEKEKEVKQLRSEGVRMKDVKMYVVAYNGAKYDHKILTRFISTSPKYSEKLKMTMPLQNNNRLLATKIGHYFNLWDPVQYIKSSLYQACKDFGLSEEDSKDIFPHLLMKKYKNINKYFSLDELNNEDIYFKDDQKKLKRDKNGKVVEWNYDKIKKMGCDISTKDGVIITYLLRDISEYYLKQDVISLVKICEKLFTSFSEGTGMNMFCYSTISALTKAGWYKNTEFINKIYIPEDCFSDTYFRKAVYGGRVEVYLPEWTAIGFDVDSVLQKNIIHHGKVLNHGYNLGKDDRYTYDNFRNGMNCCLEIDYTSLYPSAMTHFSFPAGLPQAFTENDIALFNKINRTQEEEAVYYSLKTKHAILHVKFTPNQKLIYARLPKKSSHNDLLWDLEPGEGYYATADLNDAVENFGYIINEYLDGIYWPEDLPVMRKWLERTFDIKKNGEDTGNLSMRAVGKLCGNACYGITLTRVQDKVSKYIYSTKEFKNFQKNYDIVHANILDPEKENSQYALVTGRCRAGQTRFKMGIRNGVAKQVPIHPYKYPVHIGVFVLAYSRVLMGRIYRQLFPNMLNLESDYMRAHHPRYTDTDSMIIHIDRLHLIKDLGSNMMQMKDESGKKGIILSHWYVCPKLYGTINIFKDDHMEVSITSKGVRSSDLCINDIIRLFRSGTKKQVSRECIKSYGLSDKPDDYLTQQTYIQTRTIGMTVYKGRVRVDEHGIKNEAGIYYDPYTTMNPRPTPKDKRPIPPFEKSETMARDKAISKDEWEEGEYDEELDMSESDEDDDGQETDHVSEDDEDGSLEEGEEDESSEGETESEDDIDIEEEDCDLPPKKRHMAKRSMPIYIDQEARRRRSTHSVER
jgi:hypothetical protein